MPREVLCLKVRAFLTTWTLTNNNNLQAILNVVTCKFETNSGVKLFLDGSERKHLSSCSLQLYNCVYSFFSFWGTFRIHKKSQSKCTYYFHVPTPQKIQDKSELKHHSIENSCKLGKLNSFSHRTQFAIFSLEGGYNDRQCPTRRWNEF